MISDFSNGGATSTITVYSWDPTCKKAGGTCGDANLRTLATSNNANCATARRTTRSAAWSTPPRSRCRGRSPTRAERQQRASNGEFYEGGVNLSKLGLGSRCFASVASETRSSTSTTATLKDFVLGGFGSVRQHATTQESTRRIDFDRHRIGRRSATARPSPSPGVPPGPARVQFHLRGPIGSALETSTDIGGPVAVSNTTPTVQSRFGHRHRGR